VNFKLFDQKIKSSKNNNIIPCIIEQKTKINKYRTVAFEIVSFAEQKWNIIQ
jgi:hypothetical protein